MSIQHFGKSALRTAKNYTKGYSDVQAKVREATSNDPWGPSGTQMNEIAQMTFNQNDFVEIMEMLDKRLNDKGKNWRHVFKALTVLDYLLHAGSENVVIYFRDNMYVVKTLKEFQFVDEYAKDQGANVRQKAKDITNLLQDEARLRQERRSRAHMRDRMVSGNTGPAGGDDDEGPARSRSAPPGRRGTGGGGGREDDELRRAIEESKRSAMDDEARARQTAEERDLAQAIRLSEEEEAKRKNAVEDSNARALFDDQQQLAPPTNPFPLQPQFTQVQPQFTAFNPYQQQAQQEAMQQEYLRQQQEWMLQQQQQQQQQAQLLQQQQQEEWMRQQQMMQMQQQQPQQLMAQPTGFASNNPFAAGSFSPPPMPNPLQQHQQQQQNSLSTFSLPSTFDNHPTPPPFQQSTPQPSPQPSSSAPPGPAVRTRSDGEHAHLASLFANRDDGQDTFGNIGALRYGHTQAGLAAQRTGAPNPFAAQQQQQQQQQQYQQQQYGGQQQAEQPFFSI